LDSSYFNESEILSWLQEVTDLLEHFLKGFAAILCMFGLWYRPLVAT